MIIIKLKSGKEIKVKMHAESAPNTVKNFLYLADKGFYDNLIFHRVINGFMIQGGCPNGIGTGGAGYNIKGEFMKNGVANDLTHHRGVISMARSMHPDSASCQFFIMHQDAPHLDGNYAAFGEVIEGMDVVDEIANVATDSSDKPKDAIVIEKIVVEDETIEEPEKV